MLVEAHVGALVGLAGLVVVHDVGGGKLAQPDEDARVGPRAVIHVFGRKDEAPPAEVIRDDQVVHDVPETLRNVLLPSPVHMPVLPRPSLGAHPKAPPPRLGLARR